VKSTLRQLQHFILATATLLVIQVSAADTFVTDGVVYRAVSEISSKLGMSLKSAKDGKEVILESKWSEIQFKKGSRVIEINRTKVYLGYPVIEHKKSLYMPELDWQFTVTPILVPPKISSRQRSVRTIVIDPGHGGKDPGAQNLKEKQNEKDLTLKVSKLLEKKLKKKGFKVYLTRRNDSFIELRDRSIFARKRKADLFISVHFNASSNESANGIESFAYTLLNQPSTGRKNADASDKLFRRANRNDSLNILLAYYMQKNLIADTSETDRGVKRARFTVLEELHCPGVLLELGFVRNPKTSRNLKKTTYLDTLADSIVNSVLQYQKRLKGK